MEVSGLPDLVAAIVARRGALGLNADAVDDAAGLGCRHTQKVEDAGRKITEDGRKPMPTILRLLTGIAECDSLTDEDRDQLAHILKAVIDNAHAVRCRVPTFETAALVVAALGNRIWVEWGEPPRLTQRLMRPRLSHRVRRRRPSEGRRACWSRLWWKADLRCRREAI